MKLFSNEVLIFVILPPLELVYGLFKFGLLSITAFVMIDVLGLLITVSVFLCVVTSFSHFVLVIFSRWLPL